MKAQTKMIAASLVVIMLALSAVGGITYSWFSDSDEADVDITTGKVDILSHRSIRGKLMSYFRIQSTKQGKLTFELPFSLLKLANYLCIDRSAMMRELKKLREEGVVEVDGRKVTLREPAC